MLSVSDTEVEWLPFLESFPVWAPARRPLIVVSPHPDDEVLGVGGLIASHVQKKLPVVIVAVTDGEAAYPDVTNLAAIRQREQQAAVSCLGLGNENLIRLRLPDAGVAGKQELLVTRIAALASNDSYVVAPWSNDPHPDHEACGRAAETAADLTGATLVSYFFWTWHRLHPNSLSALNLKRFELSCEIQAKKAAALSEYRSQMEHEHGEPILPPRLLGPALRSFECVAVHE